MNLSATLAAMDAVDSARSMEEQINDAVNLDARKAALRIKLRDTYAQQGVTVSEEAITRGVDEFFKSRFEFKPMETGLAKVLAGLYIKRNRIAKHVILWSLVFLCAVCLFAVGRGAIQSYNEHAVASHLASVKAAAAKVESDRLAAIKAEENRVLREAADAKARIAKLAALPDEIQSAGDAALGLAKEDVVQARIREAVIGGVGAAKAGDLTGATASLRDLQTLFNDLSSSYELRINLSSRKGGSDWVTGGWRDTRGNRRYYVVVNAVNNGSPVSVTVRSEETGEASRVSSWAEQVTQGAFEAIRAEKMRQNTLRDTLFARKDRGYLNPSYLQGFKAGQGPANSDTHRLTRW